MRTYTVSLVLEGVALTDDVIDVLVDAIGDVVPAAVGGVVTVTAPIEAPSEESAAFALIERVRSVLPDAVVVRLDQDLVSIPDIAVRTGRTRESVRQLVDGKRGPGGFPAPVGTVGDSIRVWPWAVVADWFRVALGEELGEYGVSPETAALVDAYLVRERRRRSGRATSTWTVGDRSAREASVPVTQWAAPAARLTLVA